MATNHPNSKLTEEDVEQIRQLLEWKRAEIARILSIASCAALAEKFDVHKRTIDHISNYTSHRIKSSDLKYIQKKSEETKKNISVGKLEKDNSAAGEYTRRTGIDAIDVIREMAPTHTKTAVAKFFGWKDSRSISSWLELRGYEVQFKKYIPIPPKGRGWAPIELRSARAQSLASL